MLLSQVTSSMILTESHKDFPDMSFLDKNESTLLVRVDERQKQMKADMDDLKEQITHLQLQQEMYSKKVDSIINKSVGASAVLMSIGGVITWFIQNFFFK